MIKNVKNRVWAFDLEWAPDPLAGRLLHGLDEEVAPSDVLRTMWDAAGATEDDPRPFLKTVLCRVLSVATVERFERSNGEVSLRLMSLPHDPGDAEQASESAIVGTFLDALGEHRPQLVGFNSVDSDLTILVQRGLVLGLSAPGFCARPDKPWQGVDYFARGSDYNVDLKQILGSWGKGTPSLHEIAVQSGIPGKMDVEGEQVAELWLTGELARIVAYNECDALTTYLVWLRLAHLAGHFTGDAYAREQRRIEELVEGAVSDGTRPHLAVYLEEWRRLRERVARGRGKVVEESAE